jgi:hypothetical protein
MQLCAIVDRFGTPDDAQPLVQSWSRLLRYNKIGEVFTADITAIYLDLKTLRAEDFFLLAD